MKTIDFHLFNGESTCCFNAYDESVWRIDGIAKAFTDFSKCHIPYTFKHYLAFRKVEKQLLGENVYWHHDWDKLFMFIFFPWLGQRAINQFHQKHQRHHPTYASGKDWKRNLKNPLEVDFLHFPSTLSCCFLVTLTSNVCVRFKVPANTSFPTSFSTGIDSPVTEA